MNDFLIRALLQLSALLVATVLLSIHFGLLTGLGVGLLAFFLKETKA